MGKKKDIDIVLEALKESPERYERGEGGREGGSAGGRESTRAREEGVH